MAPRSTYLRSASTAPPHIHSYEVPNHVAPIDEIPRKVHGLKHLFREAGLPGQRARR